jgi:hypothetical protein
MLQISGLGLNPVFHLRVFPDYVEGMAVHQMFKEAAFIGFWRRAGGVTECLIS